MTDIYKQGSARRNCNDCKLKSYFFACNRQYETQRLIDELETPKTSTACTYNARKFRFSLLAIIWIALNNSSVILTLKIVFELDKPDVTGTWARRRARLQISNTSKLTS